MRSAAQRLIRQPARLVDADAREIVVELRDVTAVDVWALRELVAVGRKASGAETATPMLTELTSAAE